MTQPILRGNPHPDGTFCLHSFTPHRAYKEEGRLDEITQADRDVWNMKANNNGMDRQRGSVTRLVNEIRGLLVPPVVVIPVPPSKTKTPTSGLHMISRELAKMDGIIDGGEWVYRTKDKSTAHLGGDRSIQAHLDSLAIKDGAALRGARVLVIDDMSMSGNTIAAVRQLLARAGAEQVEALIMGCTGGATPRVA